MRNLDFSSLHALLTTLISLAFITLIGVGIRMLTQVMVQQRRERMNRQINERLRALIAAYKTLGGSFTGDLTVNPAHRRDLRRPAELQPNPTQPASSPAQPDLGQTQTAVTTAAPLDLSTADQPGADRARRVRDAVEAALSDIILLGTEDQVRLAAHAATELAAGKPVHTQDLVLALRGFIREALDLDPIPADLTLPAQGPARPSASGGKADKADGRQGGGGDGGGGGAMGGGGGMGGGMGGGSGFASSTHHANTDEDDEDDLHRS